jgi:putative phage-type endonuclease
MITRANAVTERKITSVGRLVLSAHAPREEWLNARRLGIAATDVVAIMGLSKYRSAFDVWTDKIMTPDPDAPIGEAGLWGIRLEEPVAREWAERHGLKTRRIGLIQHEQHPWAIASLDRIVNGCPNGKCGLEVKTRSLHVAGQWEAAVPVDVLTQVRWQLMVSGLDHIHVAALIGGQKLIEHTVERDEEHEKQLLDAAWLVWESVQANTPPNLPPDLWTADYLEARHPDRTGDVEVPAEAVALLDEFETLGDEARRISDERERLRTQLVGYLGDGEAATHEGEPVYSFKASSSRRLNSKKLLAKYPELDDDDFIWSNSMTRTFRITRKA